MNFWKRSRGDVSGPGDSEIQSCEYVQDPVITSATSLSICKCDGFVDCSVAPSDVCATIVASSHGVQTHRCTQTGGKSRKLSVFVTNPHKRATKSRSRCKRRGSTFSDSAGNFENRDDHTRTRTSKLAYLDNTVLPPPSWDWDSTFVYQKSVIVWHFSVQCVIVVMIVRSYVSYYRHSTFLVAS